MVYLKNRAWQILVKCEKIAGFWPYHEKMRKFATKICIALVILSCSATLIIRLRKEWDVNIDIAIENTLLVMLHFTMMIKLRICMLDQPRREIFEKVEIHIETMVEEGEAAILNIYYDKAWALFIKYVAFIGVAFGIYDTLPTARMFFHYFLGNEALAKQLPFYVDCLVDEQEYFYYILAHLSIVVITCFTIEFCFELYFFLIVQHVCALFEIVKLRLETASNIFYQCDQNKKLSDSDEQVAFKIISSAVELHIEAIKLTKSIDKMYRHGFLVSVLSNMATLSPLPIVVIIYLHYPFELFRRSLMLVSAFVYFYVSFLQGQMIIDHSSSIYNTCCDFCWYNSSKRCRAGISIMMMQSLRPCQITGLLFTLSMETYCKMLKTALSYISMFAALDIAIKH